MRGNTDPPLRQLIRLRAEMDFASLQRNARLFPDDPTLGVEFGIVARICLRDWTAGSELKRPENPTRAIAVRQMALSLGTAPETTRRRINMLIARGALASAANGVLLAATPENEARVMDYYTGVHDLLLRLIEDATQTCDIDLRIGARPNFGAADVIERALDTLLLSIDAFRPTGLSWQVLTIWGWLTLVAVRKVTYDPTLSRRYANAIPPDELRVGTSLRRIAAALSMPYATVWRHARTLLGLGLVTRLDTERWTVLTHNLLNASVRNLSASPAVHLFAKLRELAALGLDPACVVQYYAHGRPAIAAFECPK